MKDTGDVLNLAKEWARAHGTQTDLLNFTDGKLTSIFMGNGMRVSVKELLEWDAKREALRRMGIGEAPIVVTPYSLGIDFGPGPSHSAAMLLRTCDNCRGTGFIRLADCNVCEGKGRVPT